MNNDSISDRERTEFFFFWRTQRLAIMDRVSEKTMHWFNVYTAKNNIGYGFGQLRPGKLGQWDLYGYLTGDQSLGCDENETLIACGLTVAEVADQKRRECLRMNNVDPDNRFEVAMFNQFQGMSPEQLDEEIARLEEQLARCELLAVSA